LLLQFRNMAALRYSRWSAIGRQSLHPRNSCRAVWVDTTRTSLRCRRRATTLIQEISAAGSNVSSACVRPAHQPHRRFDAPPGFGLLAVALLFAGTSSFRGFRNGFVAVRLQELPRILVNLGFLHSHGVILLIHRD
jgi:hypothetical protein